MAKCQHIAPDAYGVFLCVTVNSNIVDRISFVQFQLKLQIFPTRSSKRAKTFSHTHDCIRNAYEFRSSRMNKKVRVKKSIFFSLKFSWHFHLQALASKTEMHSANDWTYLWDVLWSFMDENSHTQKSQFELKYTIFGGCVRSWLSPALAHTHHIPECTSNATKSTIKY